MLSDYVLAYMNESTKMEWIMIATHFTIRSARNHAEAILDEMQNSALAIFSRSNRGLYWADRKPMYMYNRHIYSRLINPSGNISAILRNIINNLDNDWF